MRIPSPAFLLPLALLLVLAAAAPALAAPWAEPPFLALDPRLAATCLTASGGDRVAHAQEARGDFDTAHLLRVAPDGALAPDGSVRFGLLSSCPVVATAASGAAVAVANPFGAAATSCSPRRASPARRSPRRSRSRRRAGRRRRRPRRGRRRRRRRRRLGRVAPARRRLPRAPARRPARRRRPSGAVETLASSPTVHLRAAVGIDDAGRATVAWGRPARERAGPDRGGHGRARCRVRRAAAPGAGSPVRGLARARRRAGRRRAARVRGRDRGVGVRARRRARPG